MNISKENQQCYYTNIFFFFKQKTAYEIYQCDWSSDVCSSDLDATGSSLLLVPVDVKHDAAYTVRYGPASDWSFEGNLVYRETDDLWLAWEIEHE